MNDLLIVGRGPSVVGFDRWDEFPDVMAVSSAIFAIPEEARPPKHFCTLDVAKYYLHGLHTEEVTHAWQNDGHIAPWPFWNDERITKHIPECINSHGGYRRLPREVWDVLPETVRDKFMMEVMNNIHLFGFQPQWGDFSNVRGWPAETGRVASFTPGPLGLRAPDTDEKVVGVRNSWFFSVQVAALLGYKRFFFIGCDFREQRFTLSPGWAKVYWQIAREAGLEWVNLSPDSALDFLPSEVSCVPS